MRMNVSCSIYSGRTRARRRKMATKKKASKKAPARKKKVTKKAASKKAPAKKTRVRKPRDPNRKKRKLRPYESNEDRIERFMTTLIHTGEMGEIADNGKDRKRQASKVRQMAEVLDRQMRKYREDAYVDA